ncbi:protein translocase subunit SecDF [soil metagenome]
MQKIFTPKFIIVILITALSLYLTYPTLQYFRVVSGMGDNPTPEQVAQRNELLKQRDIVKLGLDLQGGADFLLELDLNRLQRRSLEDNVEALRTRLSKDADVNASVKMENPDDAANRALNIHLNEQKDLDVAAQSITEFLTEHSDTLQAPSDVKAALAAGDLIVKPTTQSFEKSANEVMDATLRVVRSRVDQFGLTNPIVTRAGNARIRVQIPGETNPDRILQNLLKTASLEFRLLHPDHDSMIKEFSDQTKPGAEGTWRIKPDLLEEVDNPSAPGAKMVRIKQNIANIPAGYVLRLGRHVEIDKQTQVPIKEKELNDLVFLVNQEAPITGSDLRRVGVETNVSDLENPIQVSMEFKPDGAEKFGQITTENVHKRFAIILDDVVYSAPNIISPITGGHGTITGGFTSAEAHDLASVLKAGALEAPLRPIETNSIGASLGADSIRDSARAIMIGGVFIVIMMIVIYGISGAIAVFAMILNVLLILAVLSLMGATLTLSGIGGILLTMGMTVDVNILIYERLREELTSGKPMRAAINTAFSRAFSVIFDSHVTQLLPALVLVLFEVVDGSMKGFWTALAIGLLANLYTGIVVTRSLIEAWYTQFKTLSVGKIYLFRNVNIRWMEYRKIGFVFSGALTVLCVVYILSTGIKFGIDFTGGVLSTVVVEKTENADRERILTQLDAQFEDVHVIRIVGKDQWQVTVAGVKNEKGVNNTDLSQRLTDATAKLELTDGRKAIAGSSQAVDPLMGNEFKYVALASLLITSALILGYLALRFQWIFGAGAVLALLHDVFLTLGVFKLTGHVVTLDIVSALLIILGYSVNDTIVVFDRIREDMQSRYSGKLIDVFDRAINETLSRTILTTATTIVATLSMWLFGGVGLRDFALVLLLGIGFGTYSSIFVASVLAYMYLEHKGHTTVMSAKKATARVAPVKERSTR